MFNISDKVICLVKGDDFISQDKFSSLPELGRTYVVRGTIIGRNDYNGKMTIGLMLVGIKGKIKNGSEWSFCSSNFVKLEDYKIYNESIKKKTIDTSNNEDIRNFGLNDDENFNFD